MSNIKYQTKSNIQIECQYRISNSISHSNFECRISNIKLNPTFKSNVEYRISNSISHSNFECRISNRLIFDIRHSKFEWWMLNIEHRTNFWLLKTTFINNILNSQPILIRFALKLFVCKCLSFQTHLLLDLRFTLKTWSGLIDYRESSLVTRSIIGIIEWFDRF